MEKDYSTIASANGWWAGFKVHNDIWFEPLALFSVRTDLRDGERNMIVGLTGYDLNEQLNRNSYDNISFRGYYHESQFEMLGVRLKESEQLKFDAFEKKDH